MDDPTELPADATEPTAEDYAEIGELAAGFGRDDRAMIRTLGTLIGEASEARASSSNRVAFAIDSMMIAACERVARICRADEDSPGCDDVCG